MAIKITEDMHVHSTFSDGVHTPEANIQQALAQGLNRFCCVDHVRRDTDWLPSFIQEVDRLRGIYPLQIFSGIETKLLNVAGDLDLPPQTEGIDYIYVADHQFPLGNEVFSPSEIRQMLASNEVKPYELIESLVSATINALQKTNRVVLAHLFSILPKIGLTESLIPMDLMSELVKTVRETEARIEVDERWECPSLLTVSHFAAAGIPIFFSSDSHHKEKIGQYLYNQKLAMELVKTYDLTPAIQNVPHLSQ